MFSAKKSRLAVAAVDLDWIARRSGSGEVAGICGDWRRTAVKNLNPDKSRDMDQSVVEKLDIYLRSFANVYKSQRVNALSRGTRAAIRTANQGVEIHVDYLAVCAIAARPVRRESCKNFKNNDAELFKSPRVVSITE